MKGATPLELYVIQTERLTLTPWSGGDLDDLHRLFTDREIARAFFQGADIPLERAALVLDADVRDAPRNGIGFWKIQTSSTAPTIGFCGFCMAVDTGCMELMFAIAPDGRGNGYALEACQAAAEVFWLKTSFPVFYARSDVGNAGAVRILERLGMEPAEPPSSPMKYRLNRPAPRAFAMGV